MTRALEWMLGLERIRFGSDAPISLQFSTAPAPWIMLVGAVVAAVVVFRIYRRSQAPLRWRWFLMITRFGVIMVALFILGRPSLLLQRNEIDPSVVAIMLDESASMRNDDVGKSESLEKGAHDAAASGVTRWNAALDVLFKQPDGLLGRLTRTHEVELWTFNHAARRIGRVRSPDDYGQLIAALSETGPAALNTDLPLALQSVFESMRGRRLSGVVMLSDGRQTIAQQAGPVEWAVGRTPVHTIGIGSESPRIDVEAAWVWAPDDVFVRDTVRVQVKLNSKGLRDDTPIALSLRDKSTNEVLTSVSARLRPNVDNWTGHLTYTPLTAGRRILELAVAPLHGEANLDNNTLDLAINAHDSRISVLYVESNPRYEYRYLKNVLIREHSVESSCLLLSASPGFTQEGTRPITQFPRSVEELNQYDVIILGDVNPHEDWLGPVRESMIVNFVADQGGGIVFLAGENGMPHRLARTRLERLLPVRLDPNFKGGPGDALVETYQPALSVEGRESVIFASSDGRTNAEFVASLPGWYWHAPVQGLQPGATVLASHPTDRNDDGPVPLIVQGRYGAGRSFFIGTDDVWRWRQYSGDGHYNYFWLQIIRTLAAGKRFNSRHRVRIETDRRRYDLGRPVKIELIADEGSSDMVGERPRVAVLDERGNPTAHVELKSVQGQPHRAQGEFIPAAAGTYTIVLPEGRAADSAAARSISVIKTEPEREWVEADPAFLKTIAAHYGGQYQPLDGDLQILIESLPDRSLQIPADVTESIWDSRLILFIFTALITAEWIARKYVGLN